MAEKRERTADTIIYGLKNCDATRRACRALSGARLVDAREEGVPRDVLQTAWERFGERLLNRRSATWRQLSPPERNLPPLELLARYPTVMKRPLIVRGADMTLGQPGGPSG